MDTDTAPACYVKAGERLYLVQGGGFLHTDGTYFPAGVQCTMEQGSGFALIMAEADTNIDHQRLTPSRKGEPMEPRQGPPAEAQSTDTDARASDVPAAPSHRAPSSHHAPAHHSSPPVELQSVTGGEGEDGDLGQVLGLGSMLQDNPWAPVVIIVLAIVAVLGGRQAWKFYSDRAAQNHELEMKKLDIQARVQGLDGAQPPPCQARDIEHEQKMNKINERIEEDEKRIGALERRLATFSGPDNDEIENMEKRLKKAERTIAALKREED